jgi:hypothetical protein
VAKESPPPDHEGRTGETGLAVARVGFAAIGAPVSPSVLGPAPLTDCITLAERDGRPPVAIEAERTINARPGQGQRAMVRHVRVLNHEGSTFGTTAPVAGRLARGLGLATGAVRPARLRMVAMSAVRSLALYA